MPALRVQSALGDTLGSAREECLLPFAPRAVRRIRGAGYLKDAQIRDCTEIVEIARLTVAWIVQRRSRDLRRSAAGTATAGSSSPIRRPVPAT
jgi:hypothetical protein